MPTLRRCPKCKNTREWKTIYAEGNIEVHDKDGYIVENHWIKPPVLVRVACNKCNTVLINKVKFTEDRSGV